MVKLIKAPTNVIESNEMRLLNVVAGTSSALTVNLNSRFTSLFGIADSYLESHIACLKRLKEKHFQGCDKPKSRGNRIFFIIFRFTRQFPLLTPHFRRSFFYFFYYYHQSSHQVD
jgi:hypothetical protein